ncbi:elongation factor 1-beta [Candidatus Woesearchaeota archaeon]|nr:elongation factor 1-beta [Candidatus Woesearchaeota archaeon]
MKVLIDMAKVVVTLDIMPDSPDVNLEELQKLAEKKIVAFGGGVGKVLVEPVAFGLNKLKLFFVMDEAKGSTESLENDLSALTGVSSVVVSDVRRAIG